MGAADVIYHIVVERNKIIPPGLLNPPNMGEHVKAPFPV